MPNDIHDVKIEQVRGYWEVTINGEFFCSADNFSEAMNELWEAYGHKVRN